MKSLKERQVYHIISTYLQMGASQEDIVRISTDLILDPKAIDENLKWIEGATCQRGKE
jgi:hypothetical protein